MRIAKRFVFFSLLPFSLALYAQENQDAGNQAASSAAQTDNNVQTVRGNDVTITASRKEGAAKESAQTVNTVTAKEIEKNPAVNVGELLADIPGIDLTDTGIAGMKRLRIRGEEASRSLILIDGVKISEQKSMDGSPILIDTASIERIEVIKGPASVLYGSEAIGGAINIITKKGGDKPIQGEAGIGFDTAAMLKTVNWGLFGSTGGFNYRFNGSYADAENRRGAGGKEISGTDFNNYNFNNYISYRWDKGSIGLRHESFRSASNVMNTMSLPHWDRDKAALSFEMRELGPLAKLSADAFFQTSLKEFHTGPSSTENRLFDAGAMIQSDWLIGSNNYLIAGLDYSYNYLDAKAVNAMGRQTVHKANEHTAALFASDEWSITETLTFNLGGRYTFVRAALTETNDGISPLASSVSHGGAGSAGLLYSFLPRANLRFTYGQGFRTPTLMQKFIAGSKVIINPDGSATIATNNPNPNLKPEFSHNFELGGRYFDHGFDMAPVLAAAYSLGINYISSVEETAGSNTYTYTNADRAHTVSAELQAAYAIASTGLRPYVNGSYIYRKVISDNFANTKTGTAPWQGKVGLAFEKTVAETAAFSADFNVKAASETKKQSSANGAVSVYEAWYTLNLGLGAQLGPQRHIGVYTGIENLLDKNYATPNSSLAEAGRSFYLRLTAKF